MPEKGCTAAPRECVNDTGRGGTCELMIGCIAKATSNTLHIDENEMDDVRWVSRDQLRKAVQDSKGMETPYHGELIA